MSVVELRGNVDTRLRKLADGECDALVLAVAGLARLGRTDAAGGLLEELVPAAGQGALAIEGRPGSCRTRCWPGFSTSDGYGVRDLAERELTRASAPPATRPSGRSRADASTTASSS